MKTVKHNLCNCIYWEVDIEIASKLRSELYSESLDDIVLKIWKRLNHGWIPEVKASITEEITL